MMIGVLAMFKKLIASALSATFLCSSVMLDRVIEPQIVHDVPLAENTKVSTNQNETKKHKSGQYDLEASNSLGKYITNVAPLNNDNVGVQAKTLDTQLEFSVTNLGFDDKTGTIAVASSQTVDCKVSVKFINEDTGELAQEVTADVKAGESVLTEAKADISKLPEYYSVSAQLVDKMGNPVGNVFKIDTYTRMIQEIKATDIHDFNAEQVVNFDESEKTNFLVLNENTVKAESSENENTLVSADYDNNTFVFDNIDDTVKNLKEGEYFYIQPSKDDIIAVSVDNISIDGDQATISGNNNIDDMFDFVKFETTTDMNNVTVDTTESDENFIFPDKKGDEKQFTYETGKPIEFCADAKRLLKYKSETSFTLSMDREKGSLSEAFGDGSPLSFKGSIEFKSSINFYKSWTKTSFGFSLTVDFNCALSLEGDNDLLSESSFTGSDAVQSWAKKQTQDIKAKIADINIPTSIPGVLIGIEPELVLKISGSLTLKFSYAPIVGFTYSTDDGFQNISQFSTDQCDATLNMQGEVFVGLVLNPGIEIVSRKIAYASFDITAGVSITIEGELSLRDSIAKICGDLSADKKVAVVNKNDDSIHACDVCFNGHVAFKLAYGFVDGYQVHFQSKKCRAGGIKFKKPFIYMFLQINSD